MVQYVVNDRTYFSIIYCLLIPPFNLIAVGDINISDFENHLVHCCTKNWI